MRATSIFKEARLIAASCTDPDRRAKLRADTDNCKEVFDRFNLSASREDMVELVACWSRLLRSMEHVGPINEGPTTTGGRVRLEPQAAAA